VLAARPTAIASRGELQAEREEFEHAERRHIVAAAGLRILARRDRRVRMIPRCEHGLPAVAPSCADIFCLSGLRTGPAGSVRCRTEERFLPGVGVYQFGCLST